MHIAEIGHDVLGRLRSLFFEVTNLVLDFVNHFVFQIVDVVLQTELTVSAVPGSVMHITTR